MRESSIALELQGKSREELLDLKLSIEGEMSLIRTRLAKARVEARKLGRYADAAWWCKAQQALRIKGRQCQQLQQALGKHRQSRTKSVEGHFLDVARERMDAANFKVFLETAKRRAL